MKNLAWSLLILFLSSCAGEEKKLEKSEPEKKIEEQRSIKEFALDYCKCMKESEETTNCEQLLIDFQNIYGSKNKEAEMEFSKEMQNCL